MEVSWMYNVAQPSKIISIDGRLQEIILARCGVEVKINLLNDCSRILGSEKPVLTTCFCHDI